MKIRALSLGFKDIKGKRRSMKLNHVATNLDEATIRTAMNQLVELNIFQDKEGVQLYAEVVDAKYIDTETQAVFSIKD